MIPILLVGLASATNWAYPDGNAPDLQTILDGASAGDTVFLNVDVAEDLDVYTDLILTTTVPPVNISGEVTVRSGTHLVLHDLTLMPSGSRALTVEAGATATLQDVDLSGDGTSLDDDGGAIAVFGGTLDLDDVGLSSFSVTDGHSGGAIYAEDAHVSTLDVDIHGNNATWGAGIYAFNSEVWLTHTHLRDNTTWSTPGCYGGGLVADWCPLVVLDHLTAMWNEAEDGGAVAWFPRDTAAELRLMGSHISDNTASDSGGGLFAYHDTHGGDLLVTDTEFVHNTALDGGGLFAADLTRIELTRVSSCEDTAEVGASLTAFDVGWAYVYNSAFLASTATVTGALAFDGTAVDLVHVDVLDTSTPATGAAIDHYDASLVLTHSVVAWSSGTGVALTATHSLSLDHNVLWNNAAAPVLPAATWSSWASQNLQVDPDFQSFSADGACGPSDVLIPTVDSPLVDSGDPSSPTDPDDTVADIGLTGGPQSDPWLWTDADMDDWPIMWDCDDTRAAIHPAADELCDNGFDDDCSGAINDDAIDANHLAWDHDSDGYPGLDTTTVTCDVAGGGWYDLTVTAIDCDDSDPDVSPSAVEVCNGADDDCSGAIDDGAADATEWWLDADGDGYGDPSAAATACDAPSPSFVPAASEHDCDDSDSLTFPGNPEVCDGRDNDCSGVADDHVTDAPSWHPDEDGDGYGAHAGAVQACLAPEGTVLDATDCDDTDGSIHPGAEDTPGDSVDQDCDGLDAPLDADRDGFSAPDDCDDSDPRVHPGADDPPWDGIDQDCSGEDARVVRGGCATSPWRSRSGSSAWLLLTLLALRGRRGAR